ncbi:MAG: hypothetical protein M1168_03200 [Candidatus Marsarchaeota archaeon]|nr:hypothetical protein [Candidatus Marsarchaeota archaeon]
MSELNKIEKLIVDVLKNFNASKEQSSKSIKDIVIKTNRSKSVTINNLDKLVRKKIIGRTIVNKSAHYFLIN